MQHPSPAPRSAGVPIAWILAAAIVACVSTPTAAADSPAESFAVHGQFTYTEQETSDFSAPYAGRNSLTPGKGAETVDVTLFLGARWWPGAEIWTSPELDQGLGLDDT